MTTPFDCIALSLLRLMWPILLCHNFMTESAFVLFANMADFISCKSRINIRPSLRLRAMIRPSFPMKHPPWSNRTCIPCSTIWPTETKILRDGGNMQDIFNECLLTTFAERDIADAPNRVCRVISGFDITGSLRLS